MFKAIQSKEAVCNPIVIRLYVVLAKEAVCVTLVYETFV